MSSGQDSNRLAVGLDAGSAWTRCVILAIEDNHIRFLGYGQAPSKGWVKGRIADAQAIGECVQYAVREAERMARVPVESVVAGIGGNTLQGFTSRGVYEFGRPRPIEEGDLSYAVHLASRVRLEDDRFVVQMLPMDFSLDGRAGFRNPKGAVCARLESNVYIATCSSREHQALVGAIHQAHLAIEETVCEVVAAAYASILPEDRTRGVALVDIGAHGSSIVVYDGDALLHTAGMSLAGEHFTRDVAQVLKLPYDDADLLKQEYGCAILGLTSEASYVELPPTDGRAPRETSRRYLNAILEARAEEIFQHIRGELVASGMDQSLYEGVVLTGGGAMLAGMCDVAEAILNCNTRNGLPVGIEGWPDEILNPAWTTVAGLAMYSARLKCHRQPRKKMPRLMGFMMR